MTKPKYEVNHMTFSSLYNIIHENAKFMSDKNVIIDVQETSTCLLLLLQLFPLLCRVDVSYETLPLDPFCASYRDSSLSE